MIHSPSETLQPIANNTLKLPVNASLKAKLTANGRQSDVPQYDCTTATGHRTTLAGVAVKNCEFDRKAIADVERAHPLAARC